MKATACISTLETLNEYAMLKLPLWGALVGDSCRLAVQQRGGDPAPAPVSVRPHGAIANVLPQFKGRTAQKVQKELHCTHRISAHVVGRRRNALWTC